MLDILANLTSTDEVAGLVQTAKEEMEEMTDYVQSFNDGWFEEEHVNATVQSWADTRVKFPNLGFHLFESDSKVMRRIRTAKIWELISNCITSSLCLGIIRTGGPGT